MTHFVMSAQSLQGVSERKSKLFTPDGEVGDPAAKVEGNDTQLLLCYCP